VLSAIRPLLDQMSQAVGVYAPDGRCLFINARTEALIGQSLEAMQGKILWEALPPTRGQDFHQAFLRVASTGVPEQFENYYPPWDLWFDNSVYLAEGMVWVISTDITEKRQNAARLELLADASRALAEAQLNIPSILNALVRHVVPLLADACGVSLYSADGKLLEVVAVHQAEGSSRESYLALSQFQRLLGAQGDSTRAVVEKRPVFRDKQTAAQLNLADHPELAGMAPAWSEFSTLCVPLRVREKVMGVLQAQRRSPRPPFSQSDGMLLEELGERAAVSLDVAQLHHETALQEEERRQLLQREQRARQAAEAAQRRSEFLSRASKELSESLDYPVTLNKLAQLAIEGFADWCTVTVHQEDGTLERVAATHRNPSKQAAVQELLRDYPPRGQMHAGVLADVARSGKPLVTLWENEEQLRAATQDERHFQLTTELGARATLMVPWHTRGELLGVLTFVRASANFDEGDISLAEELSVRAGLAVENARLFEALKASDEAFRRILRASPIGVAVTESDGTVLEANQAFRDILGNVTRSWTAAGPEAAEALAEEGAYGPVEREHSGPGRARVTVVEGMVRLREQQRNVLFTLDITERKRQESATRFLAQATELLSSSLDYEKTLTALVKSVVPELADWCAVDLLQADNTVRRIAVVHQDPRKIELAHELSRRSPTRLDAPSGLGRVLRTGEPDLVTEIPDAVIDAVPDAELREIVRGLGLKSYVCVALRSRGKILGGLTVVHSESGRRYLEADLALFQDLARKAGTSLDNALLYREAHEAIRMREDFLSVASHELKTPLTPIRLRLDVLARAAAAEPESAFTLKVKTSVELANRQVARLSELIGHLLDVSRIVAGRFKLEWERIDFAAMVRDVAARYEAQAAQVGSVLTVVAPRELWGVWDSFRLDQVLTNLVDNAVKYGAGGPIDITLVNQNGHALLTVKDHGIGIAAENLDRIFQRFERAVSHRHYGGLGLGLFITRTIVEAMEGTVKVESTLGQGATFRVDLPQAPAGQTG